LHNPGSRDYSEVINELKDPRIKYVKHEINIGAVANFLKAAKECNSKYLVIFHDDDLMHPRLIEFEIDIMERTEDMQFTATNFTYFKGEKPPFPHISLPHERLFENGADFTLSLLSEMRIAFSSVMYRTSALRRADVDQIQQRFGIIFDRPILGKLACQGTSAWLQSRLVLVRSHPNQDSATLGIGEDYFIDLARYFRDILQERWNFESARIFYTRTGFMLPLVYRYHAPGNRSSFLKLISKFRSAGLINVPILLLCLIWAEARSKLAQALKLVLPEGAFRRLSHWYYGL
jgi:glycosyltransferase involved in cell wall biosynthesis